MKQGCFKNDFLTGYWPWLVLMMFKNWFLKIFSLQLSNLNIYGDYVNNYKRAQHTVEKCAKENVQFAQIIEVSGADIVVIL